MSHQRPEAPNGFAFYGRAAVGAAVATLCAVLLNIAWLAYSAQGGRVRETGYFFLSALFVELGVNPFAHLPIAVSNYRDLTSFSELAAFLPAAYLASLTFNLLLLAPALALLAALGPSGRRAVPAVAALICLAPALLWPLDAWGMTATELVLRGRVELQHRLSLETRAGRIGSTLLTAALTLALAALALRETGLGARIRRSTEALATAGKPAAAVVLILLGVGWILRPAAALPPLEQAPNVLLISIDTLRADHLGSYGYPRPTSPRLDQLAREGARFETAVAPTSWTLPSHMSLLTGLDPLLTGVYVDTRSLPRGTDTLALRLAKLGYATGGVVSGGYLNAKWGFARGFDYYDDFSVGKRHFGADKQEITSPHILQLANRWLDQWQQRDSRRPFFLFLHFYDVHYDFNPPPPYDTMFDPDYQGTLTGLDFDTNPALKPGLPQRDLEHLLALYDGEIRHLDDHLGRFFDSLAERGVFDNTIVAVTSDHGEEFGEHGRFGHRETLYDEVLLIPLIVRFPAKIAPGTVVREQVRLIDVGPTLLGSPARTRPGSAPMTWIRSTRLERWFPCSASTASAARIA